MIFEKLIKLSMPNPEKLKNDVEEFRKKHFLLSRDQLANLWTKSVRKKYTSFGVATTIPSIIPGVGTITQIALESTTISADVVMMLRYMATTSLGIGLIYGADISNDMNNEFIKILGIWCGVILVAKDTIQKVGSKFALVQMNRKVPSMIVSKINQKIGEAVLKKLGTRWGGISVGKVIPFGVGCLISAGFNYSTISTISKISIEYYKKEETIVEESIINDEDIDSDTINF